MVIYSQRGYLNKITGLCRADGLRATVSSRQLIDTAWHENGLVLSSIIYSVDYNFAKFVFLGGIWSPKQL